MNNRYMEDTRLTAWETEKEGVTCAICDEDFDLDVCITVRYKDICMPCFDMMVDEARRMWLLPIIYDWTRRMK